jgi:pilus assembly protein TadC
MIFGIENLDTVLLGKIMLAFSSIVLVIYSVYSARKDAMEDSLFRGLRAIADSSQTGEAIESIVKRLADMKNEQCSRIFRQILHRIDDGQTFGEAVIDVSKTQSSMILKFVSELLIEVQQSGADIYEVMNLYSQKLYSFRYYARYAKSSINPNIFVVRIIGVVILPCVFYFFPLVLEEVPIPEYTFYFFAGFGAILGLLDYIIYNEWVNTVIYTPLFASLPLLLPTALQYVARFM